MGRTKGSKNKPKSNQSKSETPDVTQEPKSEKTKATAMAVEGKESAGETTPAGDPGEPIGATGQTPAESASGQSGPADVGASGATGEVGGEQKKAKKSEAGGLDEHRAATPKVKDEQHTVERMNARIRSLWRDRALEKQAASEDAKEHSEEIKRIEGEIDKLVVRLEELDIEESVNHERGLVEYRSKSSGKLIRTRPIVAADRQERLPFDKSKQAPPDEPAPAKKETFSDLRDGKVWEHDQYGCVRILAVLDESVRVQTEDLHEPAEGIEIGKADWNANAAFPREVPDLVVGQKWQMAGCTMTITTLDDRAACHDLETVAGATTGRCSRLRFCSADAKRLDETTVEEAAPPPEDDPITLEILSVGQRYSLDSFSGPAVEIKAIVDGSILIEFEGDPEHRTGTQEQVTIERFVGAVQLESRAQIDAMVKAAKGAGKGKKRSRKESEPAAAE